MLTMPFKPSRPPTASSAVPSRPMRRGGALLLMLVLSLSVLLFLGACGGESDTPTAPGAPGGSADPLLEYAQCMRDNGVTMPDPKTGDPASLYDGVDTTSPAFTTADAACGHLLEGVVQDRVAPDPQAQQEQSEKLLMLAECLRGQGIDVPDPVVGQAGGPFGGELDRNDPQTSAALQVCQQASSNAG